MIITTANLYLSFSAPMLHLKLVCQMEQRMGFISGCVCKVKNSAGIFDYLWQIATGGFHTLQQYWKKNKSDIKSVYFGY